MNNLEGQTIAGRYEIREWIGEDQLLDTFAAYDRRRDRPVMVKLLRSELATDRHFLQLFRDQVTPLCELGHPHIVPCLGFEQSRDRAFFIMDQGRGLTLDKFLWRQPGPLDIAQANLILRAICAALSHVHSLGLYHGDLNPARVWLDESGQVMVSDFGLTRLAEKIAGMPLPLISPEYSAPEQCAGQPGDHRSDIYAVAIILYEMLSRERPFCGDEAPEGGSLDMRLCWEQVHALPPSLTEVCPSCPMQVEVAVLQALAKDPEARPQSAREFYRQVTGEVLQSTYPPAMELAVMIGGKTRSRGDASSGARSIREAASRLVAFFSQPQTPEIAMAPGEAATSEADAAGGEKPSAEAPTATPTPAVEPEVADAEELGGKAPVAEPTPAAESALGTAASGTAEQVTPATEAGDVEEPLVEETNAAEPAPDIAAREGIEFAESSHATEQPAQAETLPESLPKMPEPALPLPLLPELHEPGRVRVVVPSITDHQSRAKELLQKAGAEYLRGRWDRVQVICAVILELIPGHVGAKVLSAEAAIAARTEELFTLAHEALDRGERETAADLLRQILIEDRTHREARELLRQLKQQGSERT